MVGRSSLTPDDERVFSGSYALCLAAVCSPCREMNFSSDSVVLSCAIEITSFIIYYHHDFDAHTHTHINATLFVGCICLVVVWFVVLH